MLSRRGSLAVTHLDPVEVFNYLCRKHNPYFTDDGVDYDYNSVRVLLEEEIIRFNECDSEADEYFYDMVTVGGSFKCTVMDMLDDSVMLRCSDLTVREFPLLTIK